MGYISPFFCQQIRDLSTSLNNFGSLKNYKGGRGAKALVFVGFNILILCWLAGANDEVHSFKFNPYYLTFEIWGIF